MSENKLFGYNGKIAYIDLTSSNVEIKVLDPKIAEEYIGGVGLSAKIIYDLLSDEDYEILKKDPLDKINPLVLATGPLTGSPTPSSARYSISAISPLTGIWGESTSGGFFPVALKRCGFDAIVITGEAEQPKYIAINNGNIEILDAGKLWGLNTRETIAAIKEELLKTQNEEKFRVTCIGKAGEKLVKYAAVINDEGRAAGRCGLGTVMGSKNLKAIAVRGNQKMEFANRDSLIQTAKMVANNIKNSITMQFYSHYGSLVGMDLSLLYGDVPANYFTNTEFVVDGLTGLALKEKYPVLNYSCQGCQVGCGRTTIATINDEEIEIDGPEYETTAAFGPLCGIFDFDPIIEANHICNLEGIDTISSGVSIAFLIYIVQNDIKIGIENITKKLTDIKIDEFKWGNEEIVLKLLKKTINREGIGDLIADGTRIMAEKLGVDPELAAHVKGLEVPMHDPRAYLGQALSYMTGCVGANHCKGDFYLVEGKMLTYKKIKAGDRFDINGREESVINMQDITNIYDSAVICGTPKINEALLCKILKAVTGFSSVSSAKKMYLVGKRAFILKRVISGKLGSKREDDYLKKINSVALDNGGAAGISVDLEENLKKYYEIRGLDWNTGLPTKETLEKLGI